MFLNAHDRSSRDVPSALTGNTTYPTLVSQRRRAKEGVVAEVRVLDGDVARESPPSHANKVREDAMGDGEARRRVQT